MIVSRGTDRVGAWTFWIEWMPSGEVGRDRWQLALVAASKVLRAIEENEWLLAPVRVSFDFGAYPSRSIGCADVQEGDLRSHLHAKASDAGFSRGRIEIGGVSTVRSPGEQRQQRDVIGLDCAVVEYGTILTLWTLSDVWMPYDLQAQPQPEVAALNAPRLRAALEAIESIVGGPATFEDTRFALVDRFGLRNRVVRGDVLDLEDMGYDESMIVDYWPSTPPEGGRK